MACVELHFRSRNLAHELSEMRVWLDRHGCEVAQFQCIRMSDGLRLRLEIRDGEAAAAFAAHFLGDGSKTQGTPAEIY